MTDHRDRAVDLILRLLRRLENRVVLDVGAGKGGFLEACLAAGAEQVFAFEPYPPHQDALHRFDDNPAVTVLPFALGARDGAATLHIAHDAAGQLDDVPHAPVASPDSGEVRWARDIAVPCRTLRSLVEAGTLPCEVGLLKIDTEAADLAVLQGLGALSSSVIMVEYRGGLRHAGDDPPDRIDDLIALLMPLGYHDFAIVTRHDEFEIVYVNTHPTRPVDRGHIVFVHDRARERLMPVVYEAVAHVHDRLLDRALSLRGDCLTQREIVTQLERQVEVLRDPEVRDADGTPRGPWIGPAEPGEAQRLRSGRPRVSIVTPSFNQGRFLEQTIRSVLDQGYPDLEYIIIDGGSTDESVAIIRKYADRLAYWVSEKDRGQADALNKGIARATGDVVAWLNSDDFYYPGAIAAAVEAFAENPGLGLVYGRGRRVDERADVIQEFEPTRPFDLEALMYGVDYILQPTTFMRRQVLHDAGPLHTSMHFAFDWDLWIRLGRLAPARMLNHVMAASREYATTKTHTGRFRRVEEIRRLVVRHTGQDVSVGYLNYLMNTLLEALPDAKLPAATPLREAVAMVVGLCNALLGQNRLRDAGTGDDFEVRPYPDGWIGPQLRLWRDVPIDARFLWLCGIHDRVVAHVAGPLVLRATLDGRPLGVGVVLLPGRFTVCWPVPRPLRQDGSAGRRCEVIITSAMAFVPSRFVPGSLDGRSLAYRRPDAGFSEAAPPGAIMARTGWADVTAAVVRSSGGRAARLQAALLSLRSFVLIGGRRLAGRMRRRLRARLRWP